MSIDPETTPHYPRMFAPFASGDRTLTEALTGAAERITKLESVAEAAQAVVLDASSTGRLGEDEDYGVCAKLVDTLGKALAALDNKESDNE